MSACWQSCVIKHTHKYQGEIYKLTPVTRAETDVNLGVKGLFATLSIAEKRWWGI
jgi:hypothetical protein